MSGSERVLDVLNQGVVVQHLVVKINKLLLVILNFWAVPLVLVGVFDVPAVGVSVDSNLEILLLLRVRTRGRDGILDGLEALVDVIVGVEECSIDASFESGQALLCGADGLLEGLRELDIRFMDVYELAGWRAFAFFGFFFSVEGHFGEVHSCLLYTSPSPRDGLLSRMPSSA